MEFSFVLSQFVLLSIENLKKGSQWPILWLCWVGFWLWYFISNSKLGWWSREEQQQLPYFCPKSQTLWCPYWPEDNREWHRHLRIIASHKWYHFLHFYRYPRNRRQRDSSLEAEAQLTAMLPIDCCRAHARILHIWRWQQMYDEGADRLWHCYWNWSARWGWYQNWGHGAELGKIWAGGLMDCVGLRCSILWIWTRRCSRLWYGAVVRRHYSE